MKSPDKRKLLTLFQELYPDPKSELCFENEFQLIVAVVLSAQCTDKKVNEVTPALFKSFPSFKELAAAKQSAVEKIIRPVNYYKTKAKNLIALSAIISSEHNYKVPLTFEALTALPGVGRKTANVVLNELGATATLPVDTHVFRVSQRLGLALGDTPEEIEQQLKSKFDAKHWRNLHHWLILHGRRVCKAQRPDCEICRINKLCAWVRD